MLVHHFIILFLIGKRLNYKFSFELSFIYVKRSRTLKCI